MNVMVNHMTTAKYDLPITARPFNPRLDKSKLITSGFTPLPDWQDAVARYLKEAAAMSFQFIETKIPGVVIIQPQVFGDERGYFVETFKAPDFEAAGIPTTFVQDNESSSTKGVLRGLHFQKNHTQGKLVRVTSGSVFDVAVDVRPNSPTYGQWVGVTLDSVKKQMFWIPAGFAHGFLVLSDTAVFTYKCTDVYDPTSEGGIPWNDETININWPKLDIPYKTSEKDSQHPSFKEQSFEWAEKWYTL